MVTEQYYEVMSYFEAKAALAQVPMALVTNIGQTTASIITSILQATTGASLDSLQTVLPDYLKKTGGFATLLKSLDIDTIDNYVESEITNDYANIIIALKAGIGQGVGGMHSSLYETLVGTNAMLQSYRSLLQQVAINPYIQRWANDAYTPNIADADTIWFLHNIGVMTDEQYKSYMSQNGWGAEWLGWVGQASTRQAPIPMILDFRRRGYITEETMKFMFKYYRMTGDTVDWATRLTEQYPEPYRLAEMYAKGLIDHNTYIYASGTFGLNYDFASAYHSMSLQYPALDITLALYRRGVITDADAMKYLRMQSYGESEASSMLKLTEVIPPISDLITFAVREAYLDHDPEKQYGEMVSRAGKMGLAPEVAEFYWYSHWQRIPVNLMFANLHRGFWDAKKLERMLKIVDIHPDDRQDVINVAFGPPSIREMGYGFDVGAYTLEDIIRYRRWGGLSLEDATKAGTAMVAYRTEAEREAVRREYLYLYGQGQIGDVELEAGLKWVGTNEYAIQWWIARARLYKIRMQKPTMDLEGRIPSSAEILTAFKMGLRDEDWARQSLADLNWVDERIAVAIERAQAEIAEIEEKQDVAKYRKLTLTQIQRMYKLNIISMEQMITEITIIGYSPDDAEALANVYTLVPVEEIKPKMFTDTMAHAFYNLCLYDEDDLYEHYLDEGWDGAQSGMLTMLSLLSEEYPLLQKQYAKGAISGEQMVQALIKLEMPEWNARQLVYKTYRELQVDRVSHEKDLTKAEIIKGVKNNILSVSQGAELLQGIGYDENEAYYILAINKVVEAGDPQGYWEMRRVVEAQKKARGEKSVIVPEEALQLEDLIKTMKLQMEAEKKKPNNEEAIGALAVKIGTLETQMRNLIVAKGLK